MSNPSHLLESRLRATQQELEAKASLESASSNMDPIQVAPDFNQVAFSASVKKHNVPKPTRRGLDTSRQLATHNAPYDSSSLGIMSAQLMLGAVVLKLAQKGINWAKGFWASK